MSSIRKITASFSDTYPEVESIKIQPSKGKLDLDIRVFTFEEGEQHVVYAPSIEISGYGETAEKAKKMFKEAIDFYVNNLLSSSPEKIQLELTKLGWKKEKYKNKAFSKSFIDKEGILRDFDLAPGDLKECNFAAAV